MARIYTPPAPKHWTAEELAFLRSEYPHERISLIALLLGREKHSVGAKARELGLFKSGCGRKRLWTEEDKKIICEKYPHMKTETLAKQLNRSLVSLFSIVRKLGLRKTKEYRASPEACRLRRGDGVGKETRFKKGQISWNKGVRYPKDWGPGRMKETQFKKGGRSANWKPIGSISIDVDGYAIRKIREGLGGSGNREAWEFVHRRTWMDTNGPIPPGHVIAFKTNNRQDTSIGNLECISRSELMARNTIHKLPPELRSIILLTGALKRKIRERRENGRKTGSDTYNAPRTSIRRAR